MYSHHYQCPNSIVPPTCALLSCWSPRACLQTPAQEPQARRHWSQSSPWVHVLAPSVPRRALRSSLASDAQRPASTCLHLSRRLSRSIVLFATCTAVTCRRRRPFVAMLSTGFPQRAPDSHRSEPQLPGMATSYFPDCQRRACAARHLQLPPPDAIGYIPPPFHNGFITCSYLFQALPSCCGAAS